MRLLEVYQSDADEPAYWIPLDKIIGNKIISAGFYKNVPKYDHLMISKSGYFKYWIDNELITRVRKPV